MRFVVIVGQYVYGGWKHRHLAERWAIAQFGPDGWRVAQFIDAKGAK